MKYVTIKCRSGNYGAKRNESDIKYIVWHYTGNIKGDSAEGNGNYFSRNYVGASAHRFIDGKCVVKSVPLNYIAWHCGHDPGGSYYHNTCRNYNSIGIELCVTGTANGKGKFSADTLANAITYGRKLSIEYGIDWYHHQRHYDITHKDCPRYMVGGDANEKRWREFRKAIYGGFGVNHVVEITKNRTVYSKIGTATAEQLPKGKKVKLTNLKFNSKGLLYGKTDYGWILLIGEKGTYAK